MNDIQIILPLRIISKKNSKQVGRNRSTGKTYILSSDAYTAFEQEALQLLLTQRQDRIPKGTPIRASYDIRMKGKERADLDNLIASINDVLQKSQIIEDDADIIEFVSPTRIVRNYGKFETIVRLQVINE